MAIKQYTRANESGEWDFEQVGAFLTGLGFLIGPGGIGTAFDVVAGVPTAIVRVDLDSNVPDAALAAALDIYVNPADPKRVARAYLIGRAKTIRQKQPANRTQAENDLMALLALIAPGL